VRPTSRFADLRRAPSVTWLEPRLVAEVSYSELMEARLRDAVLRGARGRRGVVLPVTSVRVSSAPLVPLPSCGPPSSGSRAAPSMGTRVSS
jgi:hypothetical protein